MEKYTFYIYDCTDNRFKNALNHIKNYLKNDHDIETVDEDYTVTNDHPAGDDCMCVDINLETKAQLKSFHHNTKENEDFIRSRPAPKVRPKRIKRVTKDL